MIHFLIPALVGLVAAWGLLAVFLARFKIRVPERVEPVSERPEGMREASWRVLDSYRSGLLAEGFVSSGPMVATFGPIKPGDVSTLPMIIESFYHPKLKFRAMAGGVIRSGALAMPRPMLGFVAVLADGGRLQVSNSTPWSPAQPGLVKLSYQLPNVTDPRTLFAFFLGVVKDTPGATSRPMTTDDWALDAQEGIRATYEAACEHAHACRTDEADIYRFRFGYAVRWAWALIPPGSWIMAALERRRVRRVADRLRQRGLLSAALETTSL